MSQIVTTDSRSGSGKSTNRRMLVVVLVCAAAVIVAGAVLLTPTLLDRALDFAASKELAGESTSPSGRWTVAAYYHNPGAGGRSWYTAELVDNTGGEPTRLIAELHDTAAIVFARNGDGPALEWQSDSVVSISGHRVQIPDGFLSQ